MIMMNMNDGGATKDSKRKIRSESKNVRMYCGENLTRCLEF